MPLKSPTFMHATCHGADAKVLKHSAGVRDKTFDDFFSLNRDSYTVKFTENPGMMATLERVLNQRGARGTRGQGDPNFSRCPTPPPTTIQALLPTESKITLYYPLQPHTYKPSTTWCIHHRGSTLYPRIKNTIRKHRNKCLKT